MRKKVYLLVTRTSYLDRENFDKPASMRMPGSVFAECYSTYESAVEALRGYVDSQKTLEPDSHISAEYGRKTDRLPVPQEVSPWFAYDVLFGVTTITPTDLGLAYMDRFIMETELDPYRSSET